MIAQVIIDINTKAIDRPFDYLVPRELEKLIDVGVAVSVPFGASNKLKNGYVIGISNKSDFPLERIKSISSIVKKSIDAGSRSITIARFIKDTFGSTMIQALKSVLPVKKKITNGKTLNILDNDLPISNIKIVLEKEQQNILDDFIMSREMGITEQALIHGVTGSGKTQVFIEIVKYVLSKGQQAIVLIPEISLTYQMVRRFIDNFGSRVGVIHSQLTAGEKYSQIERAINGQVDIMLGPRSALFTPFSSLGVIIIDEEHEDSYRSDMTPKYDARIVAEFMSKRFNIPLILASATPSIETYYNTKINKYKLYKLESRRMSATLPSIEIVDMREELSMGNTTMFSQSLINEMIKALNKKEQILLFINRRGFSNFITCQNCGNTIKCEHCDVSYTYHKNVEELRCHYCDSSIPVPSECPECGSKYLARIGVGTQHLEESVNQLFPEAKVIRMDLDTTKKGGSEALLKKFHNKSVDILIGTQMIIKGHDFPGVSLVGVILVDNTLNMNSYRSAEKTLQMLIQSAGRAGRGSIKGKAIFQTYQPEHYAITCAANQDYDSFYNQEIEYRYYAKYPPLVTMLKISIGSKNVEILNYSSDRIHKYIENAKKDGMELLGPTNEVIFKLKDYYRSCIYIKGNDRIIRYFINVIDYICDKDIELKKARISYEINPIF